MDVQPQAILVMGMHRSGTSCITSILESFGISLGPKGDLMPPSASNPRGHFESLTFYRICANLLKSAGSDWWKVSDFHVDRIPKGDLERAKLDLGRLIEVLSEDRTFALKDPRLCLLLPALKPLFPNPVFVHVVRSPVEVAMSLNERNGFGIAEGIALWEAYNRSGLMTTVDGTRLLVNYGALMADPAGECAKLFSNLQKAGVSDISLDGDIEVADLVSSDLYRQRLTRDEINEFLTPAQKQFWASLEKGQFPELDEDVGAQEQCKLLLTCLEKQFALQSSRHRKQQLKEGQQKIRTLSEELRSERENQKSQRALMATLATDLEEARAEAKQFAEANAENERRYEQQRVADERKFEELVNALKSERDDREAQRIADGRKFEELSNTLKIESEHREAQLARLDATRAELDNLSDAIRSIKRQQDEQGRALSSFALDIFTIEARINKTEDCLKSSFFDRISFGNSEFSKRDKQDFQNIRSDFDAEFYLARNPDVKAANLNPLHHYLAHGWKEERRPRVDMTNLDFLRKYPSICTSALFKLAPSQTLD